MQLRWGVKGAHSCLQQGSMVSSASVGALLIPPAAAALGQPPPTTGDGEMMSRAALRAALAWRCAVSPCGAWLFVVMVLVEFLTTWLRSMCAVL